MICLGLLTLGLSLASVRMYTRAESQLSEALTTASQINYSRLVTIALTMSGILESMRHNSIKAELFFDHALQSAKRIEHEYDLCYVYEALGEHYCQCKQWVMAKKCLDVAVDIAVRRGYRELGAMANFHLAIAHQGRGEVIAACNRVQEALQQFLLIDRYYWRISAVRKLNKQLTNDN